MASVGVRVRVLRCGPGLQDTVRGSSPQNPLAPFLLSEWCAHWPGSYEESGDFDWEDEFNF